VPKAYRTTLIQRPPPPKHHISQFHEDKEAIYAFSLINQNLHSLEQYTEDWSKRLSCFKIILEKIIYKINLHGFTK